MKPEEIHITDFLRMLLGEVPWSFLIEVVIRVFFIYLLLITSMRLMGKRMASLLNTNEMAALVSLAAATGVPILAPDRGILPAFIIGIVIITIQQFIARRAVDHPKFENMALGDIGVLVAEGQLQLKQMENNRLSRERVMSELRNKGVLNLGRVKRMYMEASGDFSFVFNEKPQAGLAILPKWDEDFCREQEKAEGYYACGSCGNLKQTQQKPTNNCERCNHHEWTAAILA